MSKPQYKLTTKHINNKTIFNEINQFIADGIQSAGVLWNSEIHRQSFAIIVEEFIEEYFVETNKITQLQVICDSRNNNVFDNANGIYFFDVEYRQKHCLNVTSLKYQIFFDKNQ